MLRIGVAGCGRVARIHLGRLLARGDVEVVGLADPEPSAAQGLADALGIAAPAFADHKELLGRVAPEALAIFAPHRAHYRPAMDALQAGCHVFVEKPLSTNAQEAEDIVTLARGRGRVVAVGHQYRLRPGLIRARALLAEGAIGRVRMIAATLAAPWLARHQEKADTWRLDPKLSGGGILADSGDHLLDALLWASGGQAAEVAAFQDKHAPGLDVVTAAAIRLADGTPASLGITGVCSSGLFELAFFGERGRVRVGDLTLRVARGEGPEEAVDLPEAAETIDGDFAAAVAEGRAPCCPASEAVATVRLLEAIARSAATGQVVKLG